MVHTVKQNQDKRALSDEVRVRRGEGRGGGKEEGELRLRGVGQHGAHD